MSQYLRGLGAYSGCSSFCALIRRRVRGRIGTVYRGRHGLCVVPSPVVSLLVSNAVRETGSVSRNSCCGGCKVRKANVTATASALTTLGGCCFRRRDLSCAALLATVEDGFGNCRRLRGGLERRTPGVKRSGSCTSLVTGSLLSSFSQSLTSGQGRHKKICQTNANATVCCVFRSGRLHTAPSKHGSNRVVPTGCSPDLFLGRGNPVSIVGSFAGRRLSHIIGNNPLALRFSRSMFDGSRAVRGLNVLIGACVILNNRRLRLGAIDQRALLRTQGRPRRRGGLVIEM